MCDEILCEMLDCRCRVVAKLFDSTCEVVLGFFETLLQTARKVANFLCRFVKECAHIEQRFSCVIT